MGVDLAIPGPVVSRVIHCTSAVPRRDITIIWQMCSIDITLGERERQREIRLILRPFPAVDAVIFQRERCREV